MYTLIANKCYMSVTVWMKDEDVQDDIVIKCNQHPNHVGFTCICSTHHCCVRGHCKNGRRYIDKR